ncbi:FAD/NAD(P)-binding protein [Acidisoma sp. 7E03]
MALPNQHGPAEGAGRPRVTVLGGGLSGSVFALTLARSPAVAAITVVEPRPALGPGLAYSTEDPAHRVNVPAAKMSIYEDDPLHFDRWLRSGNHLQDDPEGAWSDGQLYPRRALFGAYLREQVAQAAASTAGSLHHLRACATAAERTDAGGFAVTLDTGATLDSDILVLATSHPPPAAPPAIAQALAGHPSLIANPWAPDAFDTIAPEDAVLIVGTGLTMADIAVSLARRGHRGPVLAFSRRGLLPREHGAVPLPPPSWFADEPAPRTARALTARIRALIGAAGQDGLSWHAVLDDVRTHASGIWGGLDQDERRRLLRHLRSFWDAHRYRIAPPMAEALARMRASGQLRVRAAALAHIAVGDSVTVGLRPRHHGHGPVESFRADHVIIATGPAHGQLIRQSPVLASLAAQGLIQADPLGLGLAVDDRSRAIGTNGAALDFLRVVGPLARERFGELMGLPQVARQPEAVARDVARVLAGAATPASAP